MDFAQIFQPALGEARWDEQHHTMPCISMPHHRSVSIYRLLTGDLPSAHNQFVFNGDIVDRGPQAAEILVVLLVARLLHPDAVHILRGEVYFDGSCNYHHHHCHRGYRTTVINNDIIIAMSR